ncbi:Starch-binding associating with outer membrane [Mariniphaga anaerophila]|uniref:Starch-binding associating with outer membrane n=1 Tax=Mariniphaga anaerophila TaxID=1484053 RepID=A0A1M5FJG3_9BACT|nr:RagB/SusD family nutrient uptake outer membrane protein [Mariniphaga anaerophila]SHF91747.1 Starch-binding associating with outer membrane [Mariniphaga anaerophila]
MKRYICLLILLVVGVSACNDNFLNTEPTDMLSTEQLVKDPNAVKAYFATLYDLMPIEDFNFCNGRFNQFPGDGFGYLSNYVDETITSNKYYGSEFGENWKEIYKLIRNVNDFIVEINKVEEILAPDVLNTYLGEARFIRAYAYFSLVKRFGGVPVLLEPQVVVDGDVEKLNIPRNTEDEVWMAIRDDFEFAVQNMTGASEYGRANKYVAAAYLSRAMLYAGSIAKYGKLEYDGLVGVPASKANEYFQTSFNAAKLVYEEGGYELFNKVQDKSKNFSELFLEYESNPEIILAKGFDYDATKSTHSYDILCTPVYFIPGGYAGRQAPTVDILEKFEYLDGTVGPILTLNDDGTRKLYEHPLDLFRDRDPRLLGSVIAPFSQFRGEEISIQKGIHVDGSFKKGNYYNQYYHSDTKEINTTISSVRATGKYGGSFRSCLSGVYMRKYIDPNTDPKLLGVWKSRTHWIDMRFAEILLNMAEAAQELGTDRTLALTAINMVRERAGIRLLDDEELTIERIRHEREVELAFEGHLFWDLKRTRNLVERFQIWQPRRMDLYYSLDFNGYFVSFSITDGPKTYENKQYYNRIPQDEININPLLKQNPGY